MFRNRSDFKRLNSVPISVLDLVPIYQGGTSADSFRNSLDLAQQVEQWGYNRYWVAEHHNLPGIASSATSIIISHIAAGTSTLRVGSGGIMLPNHSPLIIAEQFGTLATLYPNRIDLGLGRAPGTDSETARALRRNLNHASFPQQIQELQSYFMLTDNQVKAIPGTGLEIPLWLLGSSDYSAVLAGNLGLPFAFASHFSPENTMPAIQAYREAFKPIGQIERPYVMLGVNVVAADTDEEARWLASTLEQQFLELVRGTPGQMKPPANMDDLWNEYEKQAVKRFSNATIVGNPDSVRMQLELFLEQTHADELIIHTNVFNHQSRLKSYEIVARLARRIGAADRR